MATEEVGTVHRAYFGAFSPRFPARSAKVANPSWLFPAGICGTCGKRQFWGGSGVAGASSGVVLTANNGDFPPFWRFLGAAVTSVREVASRSARG